MCTGRVDLSWLLRAFSKGADGVFIVGCHLNECNYTTHGNFHALGMVHLCQKIMELIGLNPERLMIEFMSGGEGIRFAEVMNDFGRKVKQLGPIRKSEGIDEKAVQAKLEAVTNLVPYIRLVERERLRLPFKTKAEFDAFFASEEFSRLFKELIVDKLAVEKRGTAPDFCCKNRELSPLFPGIDNDRIDQIVDKHQCEASSLIQVLLEIQKENHWLPSEVLERVSVRLQVPLTWVRHIVTFYKAFSLVPKGRHEIHICMGTACHVRGAARLLDTVQELTGIKPGETDADKKFSLETVNCLGCCALGPVMEIDGKTHGKMAPSKTADVLKNYA